MAIFKCPRITTPQRVSLLLEQSEIVYDTDAQVFYGGDGVTQGGFPIGQGVGQKTELIEISDQMILEKGLFLQSAPTIQGSVLLEFINGTRQLYGIDFVVQSSTNFLTWDGLGLDGFIEKDDIIFLQY